MSSSKNRSRPFAALAGILAMLVGSPAALGGGGDASLQVQAVAVSGQTVQITVVNTGDETITGAVSVTVAIKGRVVMVTQPVTVPEGHKAHIPVNLPAPPDEVITTGVILDDGSPF
jgi:hypothetical protein